MNTFTATIRDGGAAVEHKILAANIAEACALIEQQVKDLEAGADQPRTEWVIGVINDTYAECSLRHSENTQAWLTVEIEAPAKPLAVLALQAIAQGDLTRDAMIERATSALSQTALALDWSELGRDLRYSADDAHDGDTPPLPYAYDFLLDNPEAFGHESWPADMPQTAPGELAAAFNLAGNDSKLLHFGH